MGAYNMMEVARSLDRVSIGRESGTAANGDVRTRDIDIYDMSLLYAIAYQQHDRTYDENHEETNCDVNWFCYATRERLMKISRMKLSKFKKSKRFLIDLGLITYKEEELNRDIFNLASRNMRRYTNVYRLNFEKLAEYRVIAERVKAEGGQDEELDEETDQGAVLRPEGGRITTSGGPYYDPKDNNIRDTNNNIITKTSDDDVAKRYIELMAYNLGVDPKDIDIGSVKKNVVGRDPVKVAEICRDCRGKGTNPIGMAINKIKRLDKAELTPEAMDQQFTVAMKVKEEDKRDENPNKTLFLQVWAEVNEKLGLKTEDPERAELLKLYNEAFGTSEGYALKHALDYLKAHLTSVADAKAALKQIIDKNEGRNGQ